MDSLRHTSLNIPLQCLWHIYYVVDTLSRHSISRTSIFGLQVRFFDFGIFASFGSSVGRMIIVILRCHISDAGIVSFVTFSGSIIPSSRFVANCCLCRDLDIRLGPNGWSHGYGVYLFAFKPENSSSNLWTVRIGLNIHLLREGGKIESGGRREVFLKEKRCGY